MTEEVVVEKKEEVKVDPFETKAIELGWRPKEEWDGDEVDFIDAKEFVRRQPLFDKIDHQSKKVKDLEKALVALQQHHSRVNENAYNRALKDLKAAKRAALTDGETEKFLAIEEKIEQIEEEKTQFDQAQPQVPQTNDEYAAAHPQFLRWSEKETWYGRDEAMTAVADRFGIKFKEEGHSPTEVLRKVSEEVRKKFPKEFENHRQSRAPAVETSGSRQNTPNTDEDFKAGLSELEKKVMKTFTNQKINGKPLITEEQYIKDLRLNKGL